jgi:hypothetical protein
MMMNENININAGKAASAAAAGPKKRSVEETYQRMVWITMSVGFEIGACLIYHIPFNCAVSTGAYFGSSRHLHWLHGVEH